MPARSARVYKQRRLGSAHQTLCLSWITCQHTHTHTNSMQHMVDVSATAAQPPPPLLWKLWLNCLCELRNIYTHSSKLAGLHLRIVFCTTLCYYTTYMYAYASRFVHIDLVRRTQRTRTRKNQASVRRIVTFAMSSVSWIGGNRVVMIVK